MNSKFNHLEPKDKAQVRKLLSELKDAGSFESVKIIKKIAKIIKKYK